MALPKLFQRIFWHNNTTPAINEDNLNAMSKGLSDVDDRVISLAGTIQEDVVEIQEDMEILNAALETIDDSVASAQGSASTASAKAVIASNKALVAEGFAVGEQNGTEVGQDSDYYENNAKYYANIANPPIRVIKDYAPIISITDAINKKARDVKIKLEPVQDLHGYTKPWVGGAGKNLYIGSPSFDGYTSISSWTKQTENRNGHDVYKRSGSGAGPYKLVDLPIGTYTFSCAVKTSDGGTATIYTTYAGASTATVDIASKNVQTTTNWATYSVTFEVTTAGTVALRIAKADAGDIYISEYQIEKNGSFTSYEAYENICPITGHSEAKVTRAGRNLWDEQWEQGDFDASGSTNSNTHAIRSKNYIPIKPGLYCLRYTDFYTSSGADYNLMIVAYDSNKTFLGNIVRGRVQASTTAYLFYVPDDVGVAFLKISIGDYSDTKVINSYNNDICLNVSDSSFDGQYAPYMGEIFTIDLGGTYYFAEVDVTTGVLTNLKAKDDVTIQGIYQRPGNPVCDFAYFTLTNAFDTRTSGWATPDMSNMFSGFATGYDTETRIGYILVYDTGSHMLAVSVPKGCTLAEAQALFSGAYLIYGLATPQTIQLTAEEVTLLWAYNTLFADTGDLSLTYDASGVLRIANAKLDIDTFKSIVAASSDFADFKSRVAAL